MNSIFKYILAFAATAMLVTACSSDEPGRTNRYLPERALI